VPIVFPIGGLTYAKSMLGRFVLGGVIASIVLMGCLFGLLKWRTEDFDKSYFIGITIAIICLWIIPWGLLLIIPIIFGCSLISPAAREEWQFFKNRRIIASIILFLVVNTFAFYPVSTPEAPEQWGNPIATENPHAAAWPASEQYTWLHDGAVIGVVNIRTPHTFSVWGQDSSTVSIGVLLGMHDQRMRQSIELANSFIPTFSIDADSFYLESVESEGSHFYGADNFLIERFEVKREGFDTALANVLVVGLPNFGGELTLLTITRPSLNTQADVFEEKIVLEYLD